MATLTIRNLPDHVRDWLRLRAAKSGRSMEAEARALLAAEGTPDVAMSDAEFDALTVRLRQAFAPFRRPDVSAADELIAERRLEAQRESIDTQASDPHNAFPIRKRRV